MDDRYDRSGEDPARGPQPPQTPPTPESEQPAHAAPWPPQPLQPWPPASSGRPPEQPVPPESVPGGPPQPTEDPSEPQDAPPVPQPPYGQSGSHDAPPAGDPQPPVGWPQPPQAAEAPQSPYGQPVAPYAQPPGEGQPPAGSPPYGQPAAPYAQPGSGSPPYGSAPSYPPLPEGAYWQSRADLPPTPPRRPRRRTGRFLGMLAVALVAAILGGTVSAYVLPRLSPAYAAQGGPPPAIKVASPAVQNNSTVVTVAQKVSPAVVLVINQGQTQGTFGTQQQVATGSGIIFDSRGYIVTNYHVVYGASKLTVVLRDGTVLAAHVVGGDAPTDLAVIKVNASQPLPTAAFGDSSKVVPGELAIAIGNPLGPNLTDSVTTGVVSGVRASSYGFSAPNQQGPVNQRVTEVIQTDAAINPGNSGGPLLNAEGQVIGITAYKTVQAEPGVPASGIGFAIPSNTVKRVVNDLVQYGHVRWGYLGITLPGNTAPPWQPTPVKVSGVDPSGPAAKAGLQPGDEILDVNGKKITSTDGLIAAINNYAPGDTVTLTVKRGSRTFDLKVTLTAQAPTNTGG